MDTVAFPRERLGRQDAAELYLRTGEVEAFRQMRRDGIDLDETTADGANRGLGPFGRVRADEVVQSLGKTRGAINNVWKNQENFQAAVMAFSLDASAQDGLGLVDISFPEPREFDNVWDWVAAMAHVELTRGPRHGMEPEAGYALRWASWLGLLPYAIWSETIARESALEYRTGIDLYIDAILQPALDYFGLHLSEGSTMHDLAVGWATIVEGFWLNSCCSDRDPAGRPQSAATSLAASLVLILRGATKAQRRRAKS